MYKMIETTHLPVEKACMAFDVSKQAFYKWKKLEPQPNDDCKTLELMQRIALEFTKYGYRRMTKQLHRHGQQVNHKNKTDSTSDLSRLWYFLYIFGKKVGIKL